MWYFSLSYNLIISVCFLQILFLNATFYYNSCLILHVTIAEKPGDKANPTILKVKNLHIYYILNTLSIPS